MDFDELAGNDHHQAIFLELEFEGTLKSAYPHQGPDQKSVVCYRGFVHEDIMIKDKVSWLGRGMCLLSALVRGWYWSRKHA